MYASNEADLKRRLYRNSLPIFFTQITMKTMNNYEDDILKSSVMLSCRLSFNCTFSPEYQRQLKAEYAVDLKYCKSTQLLSLSLQLSRSEKQGTLNNQ
ncbi:hypothetical protein T09_12914 [Trichinella sp. T9]|nr:hypothetical protein T09_12914 [Trichinella sp. T9]